MTFSVCEVRHSGADRQGPGIMTDGIQRIRHWWSALKPGNQLPAYSPAPLIHSFQTAGTRFPILEGRMETEHWLTSDASVDIAPPIRIGIASLTGQRPNNEDTALVILSQITVDDNPVPICFAVVADGMGGHWGGEYANSIVAKMLAEHAVDLIILRGNAGYSARPDPGTIHDSLIEAITAAHEIVRSNLPGSGTTATCVLVLGDEAHIAHVGDSRAYLLTNGNLQLLTRDHSLAHLLEEQGGLTSLQARSHPWRSSLYRNIGMEGGLTIDSLFQRLEPASLMLLCSDGLWGALDDPVIAQACFTWGNPQTACEHLVVAGIDAGSLDNVTAIILQIPE